MDSNKPQLFPAIRAQMGEWWYYVATMTFRDIQTYVKRVSDIQETTSLKTWIQRSIDERRLAEIATYLRTQPEHFFNGIVLGIFGGNPDWFPVSVNEGHVHTGAELDERVANSFGYIKLTGKEDIFAIDGQHRVEGIKEALRNDGADLEADEQTVIFVGHTVDECGRRRTRRLFTTLNKYAKAVSSAEIIALSEDDTFALVARRLVDEYEGLGGEFVPVYKTANIPPSDKRSFTSLISLYDSVKALSVPSAGRSPSRLIHGPPEESEVEEYFQMQCEYWAAVEKSFRPIRDVFHSDPLENKAGKYRNESGGHFLLRPLGQVAFARVVRILVDRGMSLSKAVSTLRNAPLELSADPWRNVIWDPRRRGMLKANKALVKNILLFLAKQPLEPKNFPLEQEYRDALGEGEQTFSFRKK